MKFIIGTKAGMTQVFDENGVCKAVTVLQIPKAKVSQIKKQDTDGYDAVQIASGEQKDQRQGKAEKGHFGQAVRFAREYRPKAGETIADDITKDTTFDAAIFSEGDKVAVKAISKGKGFQGVVKRHGFGGGRRSHGQKHSEREPGTIGSTGLMRVLKGTKMAGRMGGDTVTIKNLTVVQVNQEENILLVAGAVPGRKGTLVEVSGL